MKSLRILGNRKTPVVRSPFVWFMEKFDFFAFVILRMDDRLAVDRVLIKKLQIFPFLFLYLGLMGPLVNNKCAALVDSFYLACLTKRGVSVVFPFHTSVICICFLDLYLSTFRPSKFIHSPSAFPSITTLELISN